MIRGALGSRYGISPLGRGVIRPAAGGWWLSGGIAAANCIAAYQPKGAADYATSKLDLTTNVRNLSDSGSPGWSTGNGWELDGTIEYLYHNNSLSLQTIACTIYLGGTQASLYPKIIHELSEAVGHPRISYVTGSQTFDNNASYSFFYGGSIYVDKNATLAMSNSNWHTFVAIAPNPVDVIYSIGASAGTYSIVGYIAALAYYSVALTQEQAYAVTDAMTAL